MGLNQQWGIKNPWNDNGNKSLMTKETCMSIVVFEEVVQYTSSLKVIVRGWKPNIKFCSKA
jgi:hypothetical protein